MFYVYVLKNIIDKKPYYGYTADLKRRLKEHGKYWKLAYYEAYALEKDARRRETKLKDYGQARTQLKKRINDSFNHI